MKSDDESWEDFGRRLSEWLESVPLREHVGSSTIYSEVQPGQFHLLLLVVNGGQMVAAHELPFFEDYQEAKQRLLGVHND